MDEIVNDDSFHVQNMYVQVSATRGTHFKNDLLKCKISSYFARLVMISAEDTNPTSLSMAFSI